MLFKTVLFGGFLFATVCAIGEKPRMASLEVLPNLDQGLTYRDFRVHFSGAGKAFSGQTVSIQIYKKDNPTSAVITYEVTADQVNKPEAYYFGKQDAEDGEYEVDVCAGTECSGRSPALTHMKNQTAAAVTCVEGKETGEGKDKKWTDTGKFELDVIGAYDMISDEEMNKLAQNPKFKSDWKKFGMEENPSYKKLETGGQVLYIAVHFDIAHYRRLFLHKAAVKDSNDVDSYAHEFCERKYLLSAHVHLIKTGTYEVKYRFKKTLYLSDGGKQIYIIDNDGQDAKTRMKVPVELAFTEVPIEAEKYDIWISFCATEKDKNDSTVCSEPFLSKDFEVKAQE